MTMSSKRCSERAVALAALLVAAALLATVAATPAGAVSGSAADAPDRVEVGSEQDVTFTLTDLYTDYDEWTLTAETGLSQVTWTVTVYDNTGSKVGQETYAGSSFEHAIDAADGADEVTVRLQGTVPEVETYSYEPAQSLTLAAFNQSQDGGAQSPIETWEAQPYTAASADARQAIDDARQAIDDAKADGADVEDAENTLNGAVSSFENANFENAGSLAENAEEAATSARESKQRTSLLMMGGGALLALLALAGIGYWLWSRRQTHDKLG